MIEFGKSLRTARETKGYTIGQLAEKTKIMPSMIEALEREDFSKIAAPIYGRGFVRLYCEAVGLDPKPLVDEFMDIMNGNREPDIRERPASVAEPPSAVPVAEPPPTPLAPQDPQQDLFAAPKPVPAPEQIIAPESVAIPAPTPLAEPADEPEFSRYAAPLRPERKPFDYISHWRIGVLAAAALVVLVLLVCGIRALYRATSPAAAETETDDVITDTAPAATGTEIEPRARQNIPSLYID